MLDVTIPSEKYNIPPFPTLSKLIKELRGCFENSSNNNIILQPGPEVLTNPSIFYVQSKLSINNIVSLQDITTCHMKHTNSLRLPSHISEVIAKVFNPSIGNLCFINYQIEGLTRKRWRLAKAELYITLKHNPRALHNPRILVTFLIVHPDDINFSAESQRYSTQYHKDDGCYNYHRTLILFVHLVMNIFTAKEIHLFLAEIGQHF